MSSKSPNKRGVVISLSGHPVPESVYENIKKKDGLNEIYGFLHPFSLDFNADPGTEIDRLFNELSKLELDSVTPLSPCSKRYLILPSLNLLSVLVVEAFSSYMGIPPVIITVAMSGKTGQHEYKRQVDLKKLKLRWRSKSRKHGQASKVVKK